MLTKLVLNHPAYLAKKEMSEHYKELSEVWLKELQFSRLQTDFLLNVIDEIDAMTDDPIVKKVCDISKERFNVDRLIHERKLFNK